MKSDKQLFISVIMPVFNRQQTVEAAVRSVLEQTYSHFELIIVDDASTDRTSQIVQSLQDARIRYVHLDQRAGAPTARNMGIKLAQAEWIAFQDSDDIWEPHKLEVQVDRLLKHREAPAPIIYTSFYRYRMNRKEYIPESDDRKKSGFIQNELLLGNFISTQTVLVHKDALLTVGGFAEDMPRLQDWELWIRLSEHHPFIWIDEPLVHVYYTDSSISSSLDKLNQAYEKIIQKHATIFRKAGPRHIASLLFSYGHNLCLAGQLHQGRKQLLRSLRYHPFSLKSLLALCSSMTGSKGYHYLYSRFMN